MNKFSKVIISLICVFTASISLVGCGSSGAALPGSGTPGVIDKTEWNDYDDILIRAQAESDMHERALLLHRAEDMLIHLRESH